MTSDTPNVPPDETQNDNDAAQQHTPAPPRWRPASEPTCCGSGCDDCPF